MSWNPKQDCSFCGASPEPWRGVVQGPGVNICSDCLELGRAVLADSSPEPLPSAHLQEGIGDDVRLSIRTNAGPLLDESLISLALRTRAHGWGALPAFLYRDPRTPDDPDSDEPADPDEPAEPEEPRPLRRARLVVVEYGPLPEPEGDKSCQTST